MKLHHRVTVKAAKRFGRWLYFWACPGCAMTSFGDRRQPDVQHAATSHAHDCRHLYRLNRQTAWPCHNCANSGRVGGTECPCCLGKGYAA